MQSVETTQAAVQGAVIMAVLMPMPVLPLDARDSLVAAIRSDPAMALEVSVELIGFGHFAEVASLFTMHAGVHLSIEPHPVLIGQHTVAVREVEQ